MLAYVLALQRKSRAVEDLMKGRTMDLDRSYRQLEERQKRLKNVNLTMRQMARVEVSVGFDLEEVLRKMCELAAVRFRIDRVGVWLFTPKQSGLKCESMFLRKPQRWTKGRVLTSGEFPGFFDALEAGTQIVAVNARLDRRTTGMKEDHLEPENIYSLLCSPIMKSGKVVGMVSYDALGGHRRWTQEETTLAGAVADFVTLALTDEERNRAESRLRESERLYHSLVENLPQFIFRKDLEGRFTFVNELFSDSVGKPVAEILGQTDEQLFPPELAAKYRKDDARVTEKREELDFVEECELSSGRVSVHTCKTPIRDELGKVVGVQGIFWDITESTRIQAELFESTERMRLFIQHTPTSVAMFDRNMCYILASRRWYEDKDLVGKDIIGKSHYEMLPDIPERWRRIHQHCLAGNSEECDEDVFERANGRIDYVRWELHPWHTKDGQVGGSILFAETITDRVNARLAIERSDAVLQAMGRVAELFLKAETWGEAVVEIRSNSVTRHGLAGSACSKMKRPRATDCRRACALSGSPHRARGKSKGRVGRILIGPTGESGGGATRWQLEGSSRATCLSFPPRSGNSSVGIRSAQCW